MPKPEKAAGNATENMGGLRDLISLKRIKKFAAKIDHSNEDKGEWDLTLFEVCKATEKKKHKNNTARPNKSVLHKKAVDQAGGKSSDKNHDDEVF